MVVDYKSDVYDSAFANPPPDPLAKLVEVRGKRTCRLGTGRHLASVKSLQSSCRTIVRLSQEGSTYYSSARDESVTGSNLTTEDTLHEEDYPYGDQPGPSASPPIVVHQTDLYPDASSAPPSASSAQPTASSTQPKASLDQQRRVSRGEESSERTALPARGRNTPDRCRPSETTHRGRATPSSEKTPAGGRATLSSEKTPVVAGGRATSSSEKTPAGGRVTPSSEKTTVVAGGRITPSSEKTPAGGRATPPAIVVANGRATPDLAVNPGRTTPWSPLGRGRGLPVAGGGPAARPLGAAGGAAEKQGGSGATDNPGGSEAGNPCGKGSGDFSEEEVEEEVASPRRPKTLSQFHQIIDVLKEQAIPGCVKVLIENLPRPEVGEEVLKELAKYVTEVRAYEMLDRGGLIAVTSESGTALFQRDYNDSRWLGPQSKPLRITIIP